MSVALGLAASLAAFVINEFVIPPAAQESHNSRDGGRRDQEPGDQGGRRGEVVSSSRTSTAGSWRAW